MELTNRTFILTTLSFFLTIILFTTSTSTAQDQTVELGIVDWQKDFEKAQKVAQKQDKPLFVLFTEVPGCSTVKGYGQDVLSHPLIADAIEQEFVPVVVYNNKKGKHRQVLNSFDEPTWNNPAVRIIKPDRSTIVPRLYGNYSVAETANTIVEALQATNRSVPKYLQLLHKEASANGQQATAIFTMYCYWTGEVKLGQIEGVVATHPGYLAGSEAVKVTYDQSTISLRELAQKVEQLDAADRFLAQDQEDVQEVQPVFGDAAQQTDDAFRYNADADNYQLQHQKSLMALDLTELQKTRINSALGLDENPRQYLSPSQHKQLP